MTQLASRVPDNHANYAALYPTTDVSFHYPEQPVSRGLKKVSFAVKAGTTTAIVGHTGGYKGLSYDAYRTCL